MTQIKTKEINLCNLRNLWLENQAQSVVKKFAVLETIARLTGFEGEIVWDTSKPNTSTNDQSRRSAQAANRGGSLVLSDDLRSLAEGWM